MKAPARATAAAAFVTASVSLPAHALLALGAAATVLALLVFAGIALPAVWSAKAARRKAAAAVLRQLLDSLAARKQQ